MSKIDELTQVEMDSKLETMMDNEALTICEKGTDRTVCYMADGPPEQQDKDAAMIVAASYLQATFGNVDKVLDYLRTSRPSYEEVMDHIKELQAWCKEIKEHHDHYGITPEVETGQTPGV